RRYGRPPPPPRCLRASAPRAGCSLPATASPGSSTSRRSRPGNASSGQSAIRWRGDWSARSRATIACAPANGSRSELLPAVGRGRVAAEVPHEQEDRRAPEAADDEGRRLLDVDGPEAGPEEEPEEHAPKTRLDALVDARCAQMHRGSLLGPE